MNTVTNQVQTETNINYKTFIKRYKTATGAYSIVGAVLLDMELAAASPAQQAQLIETVTKSRLTPQLKNEIIESIVARRVLNFKKPLF